ncbi:MAG: hypothetical protein IJ828_09165 [Treponema sp.]|nr:hypothetical protein [Treponema sp.]
MKHSCDFYMDQYLSLDKGERLSASLTLHLLTCPKCRTEVRSLLKAEKLLKKPLDIPVPIESDTITTVMKEIDPSYNLRECKVSFMQWIITGIFMILCVIALSIFPIPITEMVALLSYGMLALMIVGYCIAFIGSNLDFFIKKMETAKIK